MGVTAAVIIAGARRGADEAVGASRTAPPEHVRARRAGHGGLAFESREPADAGVSRLFRRAPDAAAFEAHQVFTLASDWWRFAEDAPGPPDVTE